MGKNKVCSYVVPFIQNGSDLEEAVKKDQSVITRDTRICTLETSERLVKNCCSVYFLTFVFVQCCFWIASNDLAITLTQRCESTQRGFNKHQKWFVMVCSYTPRFCSTPMSALQHPWCYSAALRHAVTPHVNTPRCRETPMSTLQLGLSTIVRRMPLKVLPEHPIVTS